MAMRIVASRPDPAILRLPWHLPLEEWDKDVVVHLPRGISRHVVRLVRLGSDVYAVKETRERWAFGEYRLLRDLQRLGLPTVEPVGVVEGRETPDGEPLEPCLVTKHLRFSLPYRSLFSHGLPSEDLPTLIDALVVLLVRLHLAGFYWGDVSLSNVLFRRSAGEFAAYVVDAETGELHQELSDGQRANDIEIASTNIFGELLDLQAGGLIPEDVDAFAIVERLQERYDALWNELTGTEEFNVDEMWKIEQRLERLNELGFDVEEVDIVTDWDGSTVRVQPRVVEAGHHRRELQSLTGLYVEENQARRLLNDIAGFTASSGLGGEDRAVVAHRWLTEVYEPVVAMIPEDLRGRLEPAEVYHEILEHRWYLSEQAGKEVDIFDAARDYFRQVLSKRPEEAITTASETTAEMAAVPADDEPEPDVEPEPEVITEDVVRSRAGRKRPG